MAGIQIERLDHLVLTVRDTAGTLRFYTDVLGMEEVRFGADRLALHFGDQKINVHRAEEGASTIVAKRPTPGSADLCFLVKTPIEEVKARLEAAGGVEIELGPVERVGAVGPILSVYFRDPDGNLIELSQQLNEGEGH